MASPTRSSTAPRGVLVSKVRMASFIGLSMFVAALFSSIVNDVKNFLRTFENILQTPIRTPLRALVAGPAKTARKGRMSGVYPTEINWIARS